ncbi:hypothetical protein BDN72DRAFT_834598 [Pluteus cervinus]|uniref:Uncharacterized protein n=1 Tax=Pluteus cervinus TaxID=181527 RepID=A0ACD3B6L0_9AGAR|nr:hypothetical protein BDN72DRAFT_834598 [Pluteus cervinus]
MSLRSADFGDSPLAPAFMFDLAIQEYRLGLLAAYVLQIYDWLLVSDREYEFVYKAPWSTLKGAYLLCRFYPILFYPGLLWGYGLDHQYVTCVRVWQGIHALNTPMKFLPEGVMLLRAYAFSGKSRGALSVLLVLYITLLSVTIWVFCTPTPIHDQSTFEAYGGLGCFPNYAVDIIGTRLGVLLACTISMDLASFLVVLVHSYRVYQGGSLASFFVKQGLCAFGYVVITNTVAGTLYFRTGSCVGLVFTCIVPSLIACRTILSLREKALSVSPRPMASQAERSTIGYLDSHVLDGWTVDNETRVCHQTLPVGY